MPIDEAMRLHGVADAERARVERVWARTLDWLADNQRIGWCPEQAIAWDYTSDIARELPRASHRDYSSVTDAEVATTLDVATMDGDVAVAIDFKFGRSDLESYASQASFVALAWARTVGASKARSVFVRFDEEGHEERVWSFDAMALDANAYELRASLETAMNAQPEPTPGPHCSDRYCGMRAICPATASIIRSNPDTAPLAELVATAITTPADAGRAYVQLRLVKDAVKVVEERIREVVEAQGSAPTSPGKVIRLTTTTRETFSQGRIPPERRDAVLADLRELGALTSSTSTYLREVSDAKR